MQTRTWQIHLLHPSEAPPQVIAPQSGNRDGASSMNFRSTPSEGNANGESPDMMMEVCVCGLMASHLIWWCMCVCFCACVCVQMASHLIWWWRCGCFCVRAYMYKWRAVCNDFGGVYLCVCTFLCWRAWLCLWLCLCLCLDMCACIWHISYAQSVMHRTSICIPSYACNFVLVRVCVCVCVWASIGAERRTQSTSTADGLDGLF